MATRKLKFKPKPIIGGGSVRKTKEKDDVPEFEAKKSIISDKEDPGDKQIEDSSIAEHNHHIETNSEEKVLKKLKTDDGSCVSRLEDVQCESKTNQHQDSQSDVPTSSQYIPNNKFEQQKLVPTGLVVENDQVTTASSDCNDSHKSKPKAAEVETVIVTNDSLPAKDSGNCNKSSKPDSLKGLPRFGRSRCKPILTNPGHRKKNDVKATTENVSVSLNNGFIKSPDDIPIVSGNEQLSSGNVSAIAEDNVDVSSENSVKPCESVSVIPQVRTESVIKNLRTELTRNSSIVNEITDSFSLIESNVVVDLRESNKTVPPQKSLSKECETASDGSESGYKSSFHILQTSKGGNPVVKKQIVSAQTELHSISENSVIVINLSNTALSSDCSSKQSEQESVMKVELSNTNNVPQKLPLSPLKPISKVLVPKPSPRISDIGQRRISFQGSDSEDESKRKTPQSTCDINKTCTKEKKEKVIKNESKRRRSQGSTYSKMGQETLEKLTKKFGKHKSPDKTKLTMLDLIFYNPKNNPMAIQTDNASSGRKKKEKEEVIGEALEEQLAEQQVDDVEAPSAPSAIPVPQLKVGPDGQIILDPKSLVIETTGMEKSRAELENSQVVQESGATRYNTYSKRKAQRHEWTAQETLQFYKALHTVGSDFAIMTKLFPKRSRHELKLKFKREERINLNLVDKAMTSPADFDFITLEEELREENDEIEKKKIAKKMAAEAAKRKRALKKEEQEKSKSKPNKNNNKNNKNVIKGKAFREINDADQGINPNISVSIKKSKNKKRQKSEFYDSDLEDDIHSVSSQDDENLKFLMMVKETQSGRKPKLTTKLEEYEEINETLRQKLQCQSDSEEEYVPNGPDADVLFGDPIEAPEERQWNVEITNLPNIEETVLLNNNTEDVSELSGLGSFGQNESALDLSMPVRASLQREILCEGPTDCSLLNRNIISESIQIMDELTSDIQHDNVPDETLSESKIPLPSFESVSRSRPPMVYPLHASEISVSCEDEVRESSNVDNIGFRNYYNSEECILGD